MNKTSPAFTLIELLVVFSILAILGAVAFAGYNNYSRAQLLKNAAKELRTNLQFAQNKATTQEKPLVCGTTILTAYRLVFLTNNQDYEIRAVCGSEQRVSQFKLPQPIRKNIGPNTVEFLVFTGKLNNPTDVTIVLLSDFGGSENVVITPTGVIK